MQLRIRKKPSKFRIVLRCIKIRNKSSIIIHTSWQHQVGLQLSNFCFLQKFIYIQRRMESNFLSSIIPLDGHFNLLFFASDQTMHYLKNLEREDDKSKQSIFLCCVTLVFCKQSLTLRLKKNLFKSLLLNMQGSGQNLTYFQTQVLSTQELLEMLSSHP